MSDSQVDKFLAESPTTKLQLWESQIFELLSKRATYGQITKFLATVNVQTQRTTVMKFVKAQKRAHLYKKAMSERSAGTQTTALRNNPSSPNKVKDLTNPTCVQTPVKQENPEKSSNLLPEPFAWDVKNKPKLRW
jgi:hypothetical protein